MVNPSRLSLLKTPSALTAHDLRLSSFDAILETRLPSEPRRGHTVNVLKLAAVLFRGPLARRAALILGSCQTRMGVSRELPTWTTFFGVTRTRRSA